MNKNYFKHNEDEGWNNLYAFNEKTKMFQVLDRAQEASQWDGSGVCNDQKVLIEIKTRQANLTDDYKLSGKTFFSDDLFIEDYKLGVILLQSEIENFVPIYINFLEDGTTVIHNLKKLTSYKNYTNLTIESKGYGANQLRCNRIGLLLEDATIYSQEGKLIRKNKIDSGKVYTK